MSPWNIFEPLKNSILTWYWPAEAGAESTMLPAVDAKGSAEQPVAMAINAAAHKIVKAIWIRWQGKALL